jgi:hypothetical protein
MDLLEVKEGSCKDNLRTFTLVEDIGGRHCSSGEALLDSLCRISCFPNYAADVKEHGR